MSCVQVPSSLCLLTEPPGCCCPAYSGLIVRLTGVSVPIGSFINRSFPASQTPNSIKITGTSPGLLAWTFVGTGTASLIHPTQSNPLTTYTGFNGEGSTGGPFAMPWWCTITLLGGCRYKVYIGNDPVDNGAWARSESVMMDGSSASANPAPTLSTAPGAESWASGGTISITGVP